MQLDWKLNRVGVGEVIRMLLRFDKTEMMRGRPF
jgi:hypothetical protein